MSTRLIVIVLVALLIGGLTALAVRERAQTIEAISPGPAVVGGSFSLTDQHGKRVTEQNFRGKYMLIAFGYTYCPDICPGELQVIANAMDQLGAKADAVVPVFVSIDPERDTPKQMGDFVGNFHAKIVGLTGTVEEIKEAAKAYRVYYKKEASSTGAGGSAYAMSHSTFIYLMSPTGEYVTHFVYGVTTEDMVAKLSKILGG